MKQTIFSIFLVVGICGSVNASVVTKTNSFKDLTLANQDNLPEGYSSEWVKDFSNRCKKCGKPK